MQTASRASGHVDPQTHLATSSSAPWEPCPVDCRLSGLSEPSQPGLQPSLPRQPFPSHHPSRSSQVQLCPDSKVEKPARVTCSVMLVSVAVILYHHIVALTNIPNGKWSAKKRKAKTCLKLSYHPSYRINCTGKSKGEGRDQLALGAHGLKGCLPTPRWPGELRRPWVMDKQRSPVTFLDLVPCPWLSSAWPWGD